MSEYFCFDCKAEFDKPRILETDQGRYIECPECKSDKVRFNLTRGCQDIGFKIIVEIKRED